MRSRSSQALAPESRAIPAATTTPAEGLNSVSPRTSSTRALLYDTAGHIHGAASRPITQHYPGPGFVEHDAEEIWSASRACLAEVIAAADDHEIARRYRSFADAPARIAAIRETIEETAELVTQGKAWSAQVTAGGPKAS